MMDNKSEFTKYVITYDNGDEYMAIESGVNMNTDDKIVDIMIEYDVDSLEQMELTMAIEEEFDIEISDYEQGIIYSEYIVIDLLEFIKIKQNTIIC